MLLSALYVRFRDIQPIWEVISQILFYALAVIIYVQTVTSEALLGAVLHVYMLNPIGRDPAPRSATRCVDAATPAAGAALGGWTSLLDPARASCFALFALGFVVLQPRGAADRGEPVRMDATRAGREREARR